MPIRLIARPSLIKQLHCLQHRGVRDLAWSLCSPSLFEKIPDFPLDWFAQDLIDDQLVSWLLSLDKQPKALNEHLQKQRSNRLGIYFEQLLSFYFEHYPRFTLIAKNLQVNGDKRTLGEFDFIIQDQLDGETKHIEAAVKFYLGHQNYQGVIANNIPLHNWHNWVGPNQKDTLAIKMRHLQERQLPLSQTEHGQATLSRLGIANEEIQSRLFIKGRFYQPNTNKIDGPQFSNQDLNHYYWFDSDTFFSDILTITSEKKYCILPRSLWLSALTQLDLRDNKIEVLDASELYKRIDEDITQEYNEWKIVEVNLKDKTQLEVNRFFVVNSQNLPSDK